MQIATIITSKLQSKGWSQNKLARESGINQSQISRLVNGQRENVEIKTLRAVARALGCATIDLLPEEDKCQQSQTHAA